VQWLQQQVPKLQAVLQQPLQGRLYQGILQQSPMQRLLAVPSLDSIAAVEPAGVVGSAERVLLEQEQEEAEQQEQQHKQQKQEQQELLSAVLPSHVIARAPASGPAGLALVKQEVEEQQPQQELLPAALPPPAAAAGTCGLGPAGQSLVKQELGALPSQQQLQYWQLADKPFEPADLQQLVTHYLMPRQTQTLVGRANRSGRARPALVDAPDRVQQQYPVLAPELHDLLIQVQQEQQLEQQQPGSSSSSNSSSATKHRGRSKAGSAAGSSYMESPAAVVLLRALHCLQLWESRQVTQPEMPTMLQQLAGVGSSAAAAAAAGEVEVEEVVDLTADDVGDDSSSSGAAAEAEQLAAFLAGQVEVLLVREQQQQQGGGGAAAGPRVKDEPLD
jgi:hypothetical protein